MTSIRGYAMTFSLPALEVPLPDLEQLADRTGFPRSYLPLPRPAKHAFERATTRSLPGQGRAIELPETVVEEVLKRRGVRPYGRIGLAVVDRVSDEERGRRPVRHLRGEVIIPKADDITAREQRVEATLATLELLGDEFKVRYHNHHLQRSFTREVIDGVVAEVRDTFARYSAGVVDHDQLRAAVRRWLVSHYAILTANSAAMYVVLNYSPTLPADLRALQDFIRGLTPYCVSADLMPICHVYPIADDRGMDNSPFDPFSDLRAPAHDGLTTQVEEIEKGLESAANLKGLRRAKVLETVQEKLAVAIGAAEVYQRLLQESYVTAGLRARQAEQFLHEAAQFQDELEDEFASVADRLQALAAQAHAYQTP